MSDSSEELLRQTLCHLGCSIRDAVIEGRKLHSPEALAKVSAHSAADTIYGIDRLSEDAIFIWLEKYWPESEPVEVIMEGVDSATPLCFPAGCLPQEARWRLILDPIDGTRGLMYDKRPAWVLSGIAPRLDNATSLSDVCIAAMTEIPTTKQWRADQISCVEGRGLHATATNILDGSTTPLNLQPSTATDFRHGFSSLAKFFPEGRALTAQIEEALWDELIGLGTSTSPVVFDDQYISTGGQFYEILTGHDRMIGDLRPLIHAGIDLETSLVCHPYDACCWPLLLEAGAVFEGPDGNFPDAPLDTTSPVAWLAYANHELASLARPALQKILARILTP